MNKDAIGEHQNADFGKISSVIWNIANHLRGGWKSYQYQDVILPLTVLKRLDICLYPTKQKVLGRYNDLQGKVKNYDILKSITGYDFYNTSPYTFKKLLEDPSHIEKNMRAYIDGFSENIKSIFEKFEFDKQLDKLKESDILYLIIQEFDKIDLDPTKISNHDIGLAFEELIRKFNEQSNETAGEHYTPRDIIQLMTEIIFTGEEDRLKDKNRITTIYDPACGTGGMLTVSKDFILKKYNKDSKVYLFGQELNSVTYAVCKADMLIKSTIADITCS